MFPICYLPTWCKPGQTLQATALVHEAYVRLMGSPDAERWDHRGHFFAAAATAMRRILIERARRKQRKIHGGGRQRQEFNPEQIVLPAPNDDLLALDAALAKLGEQDPVKSRLVELRFFAGLTGDQAALILGISPKTADRYWVYRRDAVAGVVIGGRYTLQEKIGEGGMGEVWVAEQERQAKKQAVEFRDKALDALRATSPPYPVTEFPWAEIIAT